MLRQQLQQKLQQKLSPQQVMLAKLLEAPTTEMEDIIRQNLEENPALEETGMNDEYASEGISGEDAVTSSDDLIRDDYRNEEDIPDYRLQANNYSREMQKDEIPVSDTTTLLENLTEQLNSRDLSDEDFIIGEYILGNIDADGYLRRSSDQLSDDLAFSSGIDISPEKIEEILDIIQDMDPPGIGARDLRECLLIQIERLKYTPEREVAYRVLQECFDEFSERRFEKIAAKLSLTEEEMKQAVQVIVKLNPKPASGMNLGNSQERLLHITPDFNVEVDDSGDIIVSLVNSRIPELKVSKTYTEMVEDYNANEQNRSAAKRTAISYIKQKLDAASGFISAIRQRQSTLLSVMTAITRIQHDFFLSGEEDDLRPMILKDLASATGYDISTISRVTNNKYVQTQYGIFPLKYFFKEYLQNDLGEDISFREIENLLRDIIEHEDKNSPLTDAQLVDRLKEKGYTMARRTVAKYRQQLNIPIAKIRKESYGV